MIELINLILNLINIKSKWCNHYYVFRKSKKMPLLTIHKIKCLDCGKTQSYLNKECALDEVDWSQKVHGSNYRKLRNGLMEGDIDVTKLDLRD